MNDPGYLLKTFSINRDGMNCISSYKTRRLSAIDVTPLKLSVWHHEMTFLFTNVQECSEATYANQNDMR